jgi:hypothetical protein
VAGILGIVFKIYTITLATKTMKKLIFLFLFGLIGGTSLTAQSTTREIIIKETTAPSGPLRSAPAPAVSAWLTNGQIDLTFLSNLGTVTITVTGNQGDVFTTTATVSEDSELVISTQNWPAGNYTITITRSNGQAFTGDFELQA